MAGNFYYARKKKRFVVAGKFYYDYFVAAGNFYYDRKKKRYSRLSGGYAIIIMTGKKKRYSRQFLVLAGNRQFFCCGG